MSIVATNKDNLEQLRKAISQAKKEILICSAWIRSGTLEKVFTEEVRQKIQQGKLNVKFIVRLGSQPDIEITDPAVFDFIYKLGKNARLKYHKSLHTKMFVIDNNFCLIGSFNLTGGGFGTESYPGNNPETGAVLKGNAKVQEFYERFYDLWENECSVMNPNLLGFVLNPSNHFEFFIVGIKPLPINQFVEINTSEGESILGKIVSSEKHTLDFYNYPQFIENFDIKLQMFKSFSFTNPISGMTKGVFFKPEIENQINVAKVTVMAKLKKTYEQENLVEVKTELNDIPPDVGKEVFGADTESLKFLYNNPDCSPAVLISNPEVK